jgi:uncharacterized Ntn-hydrolase superfamily protein
VTYSIVARDEKTGQMGIAVQSHHLAAGAHVIAAEEGTGVLAVQSYAHRGYAGLGLQLLREGISSETALAAVLDADPRGSRRAQVAILDKNGGLAAHTGSACIDAAGHEIGAGFSVQANMVLSDAVWKSMGDVYHESVGDLPLTLMDALDAAEAAGGDLRGRQSAAIHVVSIDGSSGAGVIDLRVDDHPDPLTELRRLDTLRRAAEEMTGAFDVAKAGDVAGALAILDRVQSVFGEDNQEPTAWAAVLALRERDIAEATRRLARVAKSKPDWLELIARLPAADMLDMDIQELQGLLRSLLDVFGRSQDS